LSSFARFSLILMLNTIFKKIEVATPPRFAYNLPNRQINNKLIKFLFCDTTERKAARTIVAAGGRVHVAAIEA
jgi:hypothetical protein